MALTTFADLLASDLQDHLPLCRDGDKMVTQAMLRQDVAAIATALDRDRTIAVFCQSAYRFLVAILAVWVREGRVILPPNSQEGMLTELAPHFDLLLSDSDLPFGGAALRLDQPMARAEPHDLRLPDADRCRLTFFTSGSTDKPKAIGKSLALLEREVEALEEVWGHQTAGTEVVGLVSHQHIYGMLFRVIWPVMTKRIFHARMAEYWEEVAALPNIPASTVIASPAHLTRIPPSLDIQPREIFSSGGPLSREGSLNAAAQVGRTPVEVYGSTETGGIAFRQQQADRDIPWTPLPGVKVFPAENNRLAIISRHLEDITPYLTEDQGRFTETGGFFLTGRVGRVVKVEGKRVSLAQVEHALKACSAVRDSAVFLTDDAQSILAALVVLSDGASEEFQAIGAFRMGRKLRKELRATLENAALPKRWRFLDEIPMNAQGKRPLQQMRALLDRRNANGEGL